MSDFLQNNIVWLLPIICIFLTIVIKVATKPEFLSITAIDVLDFGFDLSITSIVIFFTGIKNSIDSICLLLAMSLLIAVSVVVNRYGWDRKAEKMKPIGILIPDILGVVFLILASLYVGGKL